ncbi:hypothetical protein JD844_010953 [Phrynosoma platyrhinos]|uniref:IF rod domain-containing protein n=1 Tax=Phrynosoma platyrhinos TaxID=52577 RepID=A0ABQ7TI67_PHRPL|nr:hypothetical protein JD844_010953 [Phrynosoma platyrhinos]
MLHEKRKLQTDRENAKELAEDSKRRYEEKVNEHTAAENEFVGLKEEQGQLDKQVGDLGVVVKMDNSRNFDMDCIVAEIKKEYEEYEEAQKKRYTFKGDLKHHEQQILELKRTIKKLQCEIEHVQKENTELQKAVCDTTGKGDSALKDAQKKYATLVEALRNGKNELAGLLRDYQDLLNIKLVIDIGIATYKTLLEGEEER